MKIHPNIKYFTTTLVAVLFAAVANAATVISYTGTADPNLSPDGIDNNGNPVNVWQMTLPGGPASTGSFFTGAPNNAWASYSTADATGIALAEHTFAGGALSIGQGIQIGFANQGISTGNQIAINLKSGSTTVFSLFFEGGGPGFYQYTDNVTTGGNTGQGYGFETFFNFGFNLTSATSYTASFGAGSFTGTILDLPIDRIEIFNDAMDGSGAVFFNQLVVIPEPATGVLVVAAFLVLILAKRCRAKLSA